MNATLTTCGQTAYSRNGEPFAPTDEEKLRYQLFGLPPDVQAEEGVEEKRVIRITSRRQFALLYDILQRGDVDKIEIG